MVVVCIIVVRFLFTRLVDRLIIPLRCDESVMDFKAFHMSFE